jgi:glycerophosphoryl diester phosphodiesterase
MPFMVLTVMVVLAAHSGSARANDEAAVALLGMARPLVIAHRGYSAFAPENTRSAFQLGLAAGADLVELDYHHTQDGVPIVIHDGTLDRTTDATNRWGGQKLAVANYPLEGLRGLDAGAWFGARWSGEPLPTLEEALEAIQAQGMTLVERKAGDAATMVRLLEERGWVNQLVLQSFDWEYLRNVHELAPRQVLGALGPPSKLTDGAEPVGFTKPLSGMWLDELVKSGARVVVWNREVSPESIQEAHARGLKVWVYTINDPMLAEVLLDIGVNGLITDNVSIMWRMMALRGWTNSGKVEP